MLDAAARLPLHLYSVSGVWENKGSGGKVTTRKHSSGKGFDLGQSSLENPEICSALSIHPYRHISDKITMSVSGKYSMPFNWKGLNFGQSVLENPLICIV